MTPKDKISDQRFMVIYDALNFTKATIRNGLVAVDLPDLIRGVEHMCFHQNIETDNPVRHAEISFKFRSFGSYQQARIGGALAAALITDKSICAILDDPKQPLPWEMDIEKWRKFLSFTMSIAEDFIDLDTEIASLGKRSNAGNFVENYTDNRRRFDDVYNDDRLKLGEPE